MPDWLCEGHQVHCYSHHHLVAHGAWLSERARASSTSFMISPPCTLPSALACSGRMNCTNWTRDLGDGAPDFDWIAHPPISLRRSLTRLKISGSSSSTSTMS